ncbi:MAG TPA: hypothetical protein VF941_21625, partial [Clostridia bacterium]
MYIESVISFNNSWEIFKSNYQREYEELKIILSEYIFKEFVSDITTCDISPENYWFQIIERYAWHPYEDGKLLQYFASKNGVLVHLKDSISFIFQDIFADYFMSIKNKLISIPISIYCSNSVDVGEIGPRFEAILDQLSYSKISIDYPLIILGITDIPIDERNIKIHSFNNYESDGFKNIVTRSIEFPPEYYQAGLGILSYFNKILKERYPNTKAKVQIIQEDLKVIMIIETGDGQKEVVEKALHEYGLILKGELEPIGFSQFQILELKSEIRIAEARIENQQEIMQLQN